MAYAGRAGHPRSAAISFKWRKTQEAGLHSFTLASGLLIPSHAQPRHP